MLAATAAATTLLTGCAAPVKTDYSAFRAAKPASILVLPPLNDSTDVNATFSMLAQSTYPLAESGYYVMPVTLVNETFHQNGLTMPTDMHEVPAAKLTEIFGADAALYMKVTRYGSTYTVPSSAAIVKQIMNNVTDASHNVAGITSSRLLSAGMPNGLLYGPRSPLYGKDGGN